MDLFAFPIEIRLKIYSHLLTHDGPITLLATFCDDMSSRLCPEGIDFCPSLLCASKQVYSEAISLLYANNCFRFSDMDSAPTRYHMTIAAVLRQVGAQASLLRHVCIGFPTVPLAEDYKHDPKLLEHGLYSLDLLRDACPSITTLELSLPSERAEFVLHSSIFTELLDLIRTRLEAFQLLREVKVGLELLGQSPDERTIDGAEDAENGEKKESCDDQWKSHRDSLWQLRSRGWAVNIAEMSPVKEVWVSPDDMIEFDNEDDYDEYMIEWYGREQEREDDELADYYRQRQLESYRMGYADDGGPA